MCEKEYPDVDELVVVMVRRVSPPAARAKSCTAASRDGAHFRFLPGTTLRSPACHIHMVVSVSLLHV